MMKLADLTAEDGKAMIYLESVCSGKRLGVFLTEIHRVTTIFECKYKNGASLLGKLTYV